MEGKKRTKQQELILRYIDHFGSITPLQAFADLGITKLATRVSELARDGVAFHKEMVTGNNRFGEKVHFMRYSLAQ